MHTQYRWALLAALSAGTVWASPTVAIHKSMQQSGLALAAISEADPAEGGSKALTVSGPTSVTVTGPAIIAIGSTAQFVATVVGSSDTSVTWQVNGTTGGNSTYGTISKSGLYTPPTSVPAKRGITVNAYSNYNGVAGNVTSTILYPKPAITGVMSSTSDGGQTFTVNVYGTSFIPGAQVLIAGTPVPTTSPVPGDLVTTVSNPGGAATRITLVVENPNPAIGRSSADTIMLTPTKTSPTAAARFLDQATFGPTASTIAHVEQIGLSAALTEQFNEPTTLFSQPPFPQTECSPLSTNLCETQSEFLKVAAWGNDQLRQRVAMALSEIWVAPNTQANAMPYYLNTLASDAFTNYRQIMQDATLAPNMGFYLNMLNSGAAPQGQVANENFGREVMQLFTIGLNLLNPNGTPQLDSNGNPIPAYTEAQVQAFARAFTGWTYANPDGSTPLAFVFYTPNWRHPMVAVESLHDETAKTLLNGTTLPPGQSAEADLSDALDNIFAHPNVGPFVCRKLIQQLVTGDPSPAYVERVAAVFANNGYGVRGDMKSILKAILMDEEARAGDTQTGDEAESNPAVPNGGHLREPLLWTVNLVRALNGTLANPADPYSAGTFMGLQMGPLGDEPLEQLDVFNFFSPQFVIPLTTINSPEFELENSGTVAPRLSRADTIVANQAVGLNIDLSATSPIGQTAADPAQLVDTLGFLFMHSQMPSDMRSTIIGAVSAIPANVPLMRAQVAAYLVVTSSQYKIMH